MFKKKKQLLALLLCLSMTFSNVISVSAAEESEPEAAKEFVQETESIVEVEEETQEMESNSDVMPVTLETEEEVDASTWTSADFTYTSYEKRLYGCDYSRDFVIQGSAIAGFSETGLAKLEKNTDLVLPAVDDEGYTVVGVASSAFKNKGLTSVTFPTGMMVNYEDTVTNGKITKRGNFIIAENAFSGNKLTSVSLPEGVIACLPNAFANNQITTVKFPKTIWWIETMSFAKNRITTVNFPTICDFQLEMHGMPFASNFIKSVRLPDYTEVVNKDTFMWNTGKEPLAEDAAAKYKTYKVDGQTYDAGVVYMYTDNKELAEKDRIHHDRQETSSQFSYFQKLIVNDGTTDTENQDLPWNVNDFTFDGQTVTGLSELGIAKRATNKDLVIPDLNKEGMYVTAIADGKAGGCGLFGAEGEGFDSVYLPSGLQTIGSYAFQNNGLKEVTFPSRLTTIGALAFQTNNLTSVILPDTVTSLGNGAFATNPKLERINLSKGLTKIPESAFGCSDPNNYMTNLTSIELHEGITEIGKRAFAGNNFSSIEIPSTVKKIGDYAFSTKNYLKTPCTVTLNEGLEVIGNNAFRNKVIAEITLPKTVTKIGAKTFLKEYSDETSGVVTKVYVSLKSQYEDTKNFPNSDYHKLYLTDVEVWTAEDFTYGEESYAVYPMDQYSSVPNFTAYVVTGFSEYGEAKLETNKNIVIPAQDSNGKKIQGVGKSAFQKKGIESLVLPENVKTVWDGKWEAKTREITERGDFFIGASAFQGNKLTVLEIPEGVFYIGGNAFQSNQLTTVKMPTTIMQISNQAFARNKISTLEFTATTEFPLQIDSMAFGANKIQSVQLPSNIEKLDKNAFVSNTDANNNKIAVEIYIDAENTGDLVADSNKNHTLNVGTNIPNEKTPWNVNDFTYDEEGTTITGLSEAGTVKIKENPTIILPKVGPTGEAITALGNGANNKGIFVVNADDKYYTPASVQLPATLEKIGNWAFALGSETYEAEMSSITFPNGLKEIGQMAFQNSKLTAVSIPDSVTVMGVATFTGSTQIQSIRLSANVAEIPANAFANGGKSLSEFGTLEIPEGVTSIGASAFAGRHIKNIIWSSTLEKIGNKAFENHQMTTLEIPGNVKSIGQQAFRIYQDGIENTLTTLVLHEGLESIGKEAFTGCKITEVAIPSSLTLSTTVFIFGKKNVAPNPIVTLKIADKVKAGEVGAAGSYNSENVNTWSHVVVYDKFAGTGWTAEDFTYDGTVITGWSESGQAKRKTLRTLVLPDLTPDGKDITAIGEAAFKIPDEEVEITKFGVDSPNGMTTVSLPEKATIIGKEAFAQNALTKVDFTGITSIGEKAFYGNDLVEAILPDTVIELGDGVFSANDITNIRLSNGVTKIPAGAFSMNIRLEQIEIPNTVTEIGQTAFAGARLTSLVIPESVEKIGYKAFHLHHLAELVIPGNVKEIGESAFEGTYKATTLKSLVIEDGVEKIGKYAFKEALLEKVHFPESVKEVGEKPFLNNKGKDGSHVVEITTTNKAHRNLSDTTYKINYIGKIELEEVKDKLVLSFEKADYSGEEIKPVVTIEGLKEGEDFTVSYGNNILVGTAEVIVTGAGQYVGTFVEKFAIVLPKDTDLIVKPSTPVTKVEGLDKESVANDVLTEEEKAQNVQVYLTVEKVSEDKIAVQDILATNEIVSKHAGLEKGMYLDISMWKFTTDNVSEKIQNAELSKKLTISVELPDKLIVTSGKTRAYYVVRVHDGAAEILPATLNGNTIRFETDRFSTYSIWYTEADVSDDSSTGTNAGENVGTNTKPENSSQVKTGDDTQMNIWWMLCAVSALVFAGTSVIRRKKNHNF